MTTGPRGELNVARYAPLPDQAVRKALTEYARCQAGQRSRIDVMRRFAQSRGCRMQSLLGYFGERARTANPGRRRQTLGQRRSAWTG